MRMKMTTNIPSAKTEISTKLLKKHLNPTFSVKEKRLLNACSIERIIDTTCQILDSIEARNRLVSKDETLDELIDINSQDWEDVKTIAVKLWDAARNRLFIEILDERTEPVIAASTRSTTNKVEAKS